ncbi:hypothetical protein PIB30_057151 [Stylosanthes scabra]|uniref:Uncharacterized protein n=1 Tax=Stylosanthes scabra TaxID=79078 RepID=A0ABU6WJJ9_9FABA|nr:hypothetical protein [Stylosanthes scabra]
MNEESLKTQLLRAAGPLLQPQGPDVRSHVLNRGPLIPTFGPRAVTRGQACGRTQLIEATRSGFVQPRDRTRGPCNGTTHAMAHRRRAVARCGQRATRIGFSIRASARWGRAIVRPGQKPPNFYLWFRAAAWACRVAAWGAMY